MTLPPPPSRWRRLGARFLSLWLLLSPSGFVGAAIQPQLRDNAATDTRQASETYRNVGKRGQQQADRQEQRTTATGTILEAGKTLSVDSTGNTTVVGGALAAGEKMQLAIGGNLTLTTAELNATQNIALAAGGNVTLAASKDSRQASFSGRGTRNRQLDETARGSQINAGGQITVLATDFNKLVEAAPTAAGAPAAPAIAATPERNISLEAASLNSKSGSVTVAADGNLTVKEATERHEAMSETRKSSRGFFSSKTTTTRSESSSEIAVGSTISGDSVRMESGRDMAVRGSNVVATNDTTLIAGNKLSVEAAHETHNESHFTETRQSGQFSSGGIGVTLGSKQQSTDQKSEASTAGKSTIGSTDGNVTLLAGEKYRQVGSDVIAVQGDIDIAARQVDIVEARETSRTTIEQKSKQSGFTVAFTNPVITAVQTAQQMASAAKDTSDPRMKALAAASTGLAGYNAGKAVMDSQGKTVELRDGTVKDNQIPVLNEKGEVADYRDATAADKMGGVGINLSIGGSKSSSKTTQTSDTAAVSNLTAGRDIRIEASGAGSESDILLQGTKATAARNLTLTAEDEIRLLAARNTFEQHSSNKNSSASLGIGFMVGGTQNGFTIQAGVSGGKGKADGQDISHSNTHVEAGQTLTLQSGGDTLLRGAVAKGEQVKADIGKDLKIESLQDTSTYDSKQKSAGVSVSLCIPPFCYGAPSSGSISASGSKVKSDYASVTEQSAIRAGDGGFDVKVKNDTDLKGGAITSTQQAIDNQLNRFETGGQLTTSDIENKAEYTAKSASINIGTGFSAAGALVPQGTSAGFGKDSGSASSTTQAAISGIAGNKEARTGDKETGIAKIFDQEKVQKEIEAQTKITQMFGQLAPKAVGNFANDKETELRLRAGQAEGAERERLLREADAWAEGGINRVALHTVVGGLGGGTAGALGAGASSAMTPILAEQIAALDVPFELKMVLIQAAGTAVGGLAGGAAGAAAGLNETGNNLVQFLARAGQIAGQVARVGLDKLSAAEAAMLQSCISNTACRSLVGGVLSAGAMQSLISQSTAKPQSSLVDQIPTGFADGDRPQPPGPLVNVPIERDPKDSTLVNVPVSVDTSLPGYTPENPPAADGPLVTPNNGPMGGTILYSEEARDFEKSLVGLPDGEKQAVVIEVLRDVAINNGFVKDGRLTRMNDRDVFVAPDGKLYAADYQHGRFEVTDSKGRHLGEVNISLEPTKPADNSGRHNLRTR